MKKLYKVLLVEDNESNAELIRHTLEKYNFAVTIAENGLMGFRLIRKMKFDLLISDVMMPAMDGISFIQKSLNELVGTPVILLTSDSSRETVLKAKEMLVNSYMLKPIVPNMLLEKVQEIMELKPGDIFEKKKFLFEFSIDFQDSQLSIHLKGIPTKSIYWEILEMAYTQNGHWERVLSVNLCIDSDFYFAAKSIEYIEEFVVEVRKRATKLKNKKFRIFGKYFNHFQRKEFTSSGEMMKCSIEFPENSETS